MKMKKLAIASAVSAAMGMGAALPAFAAVTGLPGEALLVPLTLHDPEDEDDELNDGSDGGGGATNRPTDIHTYVNIRIPVTVGQDYVLNTYTAPNVTGDGKVVNQGVPNKAYDMRVHWTAYSHRSDEITNGDCYVSPGDSVLWSTDHSIYEEQEEAGFIPCGPLGGLGLDENGRGYVGYVLFQTYAGADNLDADFVMEGNAWILDPQVVAEAGNGHSILAVPVMPMADGRDTIVNGETVGPLQLAKNEVINYGAPDGTASMPKFYAPLAAGIRMNNGDGKVNRVHFAGPVQGYQGSFSDDQNTGVSLHAFWFDRNANRSSQSHIWDEDEGARSFNIPLRHEVNLYAYNLACDVTRAEIAGRKDIPWRVFKEYCDDEDNEQDVALTNIVEAIENISNNNGYENRDLSPPPAWEDTMMGYVEYNVPEAADDDGAVTSAAVAFTAQEEDDENTAWGGAQMMSARGFHQ